MMFWIIVMLWSALTFALAHISMKKLLLESEAIDLIASTGLLFLPMFMPFIGLVDFNVAPQIILYTLIASILGIVGYFCINKAYKDCEISSVSPLLNLSPIFLLVLAVAFLGERITLLQFFGIMVILLGGYIITLSDLRHMLKPFTALRPRYYILVSGTLIAWSFGQLLMRIILLRTTVWTYLFFFSAGIFIFSIVILIRRRSYMTLLFRRHWRFILMIEIFAFASDMAHVFAFSLPDVMISLSMPIKRMSSLFVVLIGGTAFQEKKLFQKIVASVLMLAGLLIIGLS